MTKKYRWGRLFLFLIVLLAIVGFFWLRAMTRFGEFSTITPRFDGACKRELPKAAGIEDLALFKRRDKNLILLSSYDRIRAKQDPSIDGSIYLYELENLNSEPIQIIKPQHDFAPIGLDYYQGGEGQIGVINNSKRSKIELFKFVGDKYEHEKSIDILGANRLNDLAFFDENRFYVTNESENQSKSLKDFILNFLDLDKTGEIYFYDGIKARKVATGMSFANSVVISKDKKFLIASATLGRELRFYSIKSDNSLELVKSVFVGTGVDNLSIDEAGQIFAATHPKLFTLMRKIWFNSENPFGQVIVIEPNADFTTGKIDQVYLSNDATRMGSVSVAAKFENKLIMGSIFDNGLLVCDLPPEWRQSKTHPANRLIDTSRDYQIKKAKKDLKIEQ